MLRCLKCNPIQEDPLIEIFDVAQLCDVCGCALSRLKGSQPYDYVPPPVGPDEIEEAEEDTGEISEITDLADKTKKELKEMAKDLGITGYSKMNKDKLIKAINAAD